MFYFLFFICKHILLILNQKKMETKHRTRSDCRYYQVQRNSLTRSRFGMLFFKYICLLLFLVVGMSCKKEDDPGKKEGDIKIENLQTRLRIVVSPLVGSDVEHVWRANPENMLIHYPPYGSYKGNTYFGYTDEKGETVLCKVKNLPASVKERKGEFVYKNTLSTITEINVQLSGIVRIETDSLGKKQGTMDLTSIVPTGPKPKPVLQLGMYAHTYPTLGGKSVKIEFIDRKILKLMEPGLPVKTYHYEIFDTEHAIMLKDVTGVVPEQKMFFHVISNSEFETDCFCGYTAEYPGQVLMTFKKEEQLKKVTL